MAVDTHAHLYVSHFDRDRDEVVLRARQYLSAVVLPNIHLSTVAPMERLADAYPDFCFPALGLHPCEVKSDFRDVLASMEPMFARRRYVAVGETGLDYYHDKTYVAEQKKSLAVHLQWAKDMGLPVVLHCRNSFDDVLGMVEKAQDGRLTGVFHCFAGTAEEGKRVADVGFYMGIGGVLTYPQSGLAQTLPSLPIERVVLETDAPYLPPVPFRGKRNESVYVRYVVAAVAKILHIPEERVVETTTRNARRLFPRINPRVP
jgi:TatD DNase family protein